MKRLKNILMVISVLLFVGCTSTKQNETFDIQGELDSLDLVSFLLNAEDELDSGDIWTQIPIKLDGTELFNGDLA